MNVNSLQTGGFTTIFGGDGEDVIMVSDSKFGNNVGVRGEASNDFLCLDNTILTSHAAFYGGLETDSMYQHSLYSNFELQTFSVESDSTEPNSTGEAERAIRPLAEWLVSDARTMECRHGEPNAE